MPSRKALVDHVRTYKGVEWQHQGRTKHGMDCFGPLLGACDFLGVKYTDIRDYGRLGLPGQICELVESYGAVRVGNVQPGDFGVFWLDPTTKADQHVGIFTPHPHNLFNAPYIQLLHSYLDVGKVVEHPFSGRWRRRMIAAYSFPGLETRPWQPSF